MGELGASGGNDVVEQFWIRALEGGAVSWSSVCVCSSGWGHEPWPSPSRRVGAAGHWALSASSHPCAESEQLLKCEYFLKNPIFYCPASSNYSSLLTKTIQVYFVKNVFCLR